MSTQTTDKKNTNIGRVILKGVRFSYFHGFKPHAMKPKPGEAPKAPKYGVTAIMDKKDNAEAIRLINEAFKAIIQDKWAGKKPVGLKLCLRDGSEYEGADGYGEDVMFVAASADVDKFNPAESIRDCDKSRKLTAADNRPYSGCYGNLVVRFWPQDNDWGKRINCALEVIQFVKHGEPLGMTAVKADDVLEDEAPLPEDEVTFDD